MKLSLLLFLFLLSFNSFGQRLSETLVLKGTVFGYTYDDTKSIFKKDKKIELEGSLANVELKLKNGRGEVVQTKKSSSGGEFVFNIPTQDSYTIIYSKSGYGTSAFEIDLKSIPSEIMEWGLVLKNIEIILNNYESDKPQDNGTSFGLIHFDEGNERFEFKEHEFSQKKRLFKKNQENTTLNLMNLSLDKNAELNVYSKRSETASLDNSEELDKNREMKMEGEDWTASFSENYIIAEQRISALSELNVKNKDLTQADILEFGDKIRAERLLLEEDKLHALTELDYLNIAAREKLLESAERELASAESYIAEQEGKLKAQQNFIIAIISVLILILLLALFLWRAFRQKKKNNILLAEKNRKIQDSINYALKIQRSVLLSDAQIKAILPNSFVYYQPLDSVSGDFYWFSKVNNVTIIAAVDCTGHGVPGAFMSLIGNTLMNQIVNEDGVLKPSDILKELHKGIVQSLQQTENDEAAQDGMDISVCAINHEENLLSMAGAMNAVYLLQNDEIKTLKPDLRTIGGYVRKGKSINFNEQEIAVNKGDRIYLFSDGFMDQFGGAKDEKFNISRFKDLILELKAMPVEDQESAFKKSHLDWKMDTAQTDDLLVIGVEI